MAKCDVCGEEVEGLAYECNECGGIHCSKHQLPENHDCAGLQDWGDPATIEGPGLDDGTEPGDPTGGGLAGRGGALGYFRGNVAFLFLALMWVTWGLQQLVLRGLPTFGVLSPLEALRLHNTLFVLQASQLGNVWTLVTSIFAHDPSGFLHIAGNSLIIYFFGTTVEKYVGSRNFVVLALVSGVLAGLGQVLLSAFVFGQTAAGVLGASGVGLAVLGVMTVLNPQATVWLIPIPVPIPIWVLTIGYAVLSSVGVVAGGSVGGIAHAAHLLGLAVGLAYGQYYKDKVSPRDEIRMGGGLGGGRGPGGPGGPGGRL